ncbi:exosortase/archaeosortase family protein [Candidatus Micrarchaeota archaeon]|nr:exosortase/archaeosortase family protein [Candidatus Micrarchaeota archaeon]
MASQASRKQRKARKQRNNPLQDAFKFIALFLVLSIPAFLLLQNLSLLNLIAAYSSAFLLSTVFHLPAHVLPSNPYPIIGMSTFMVEIIDLCAAKVEIAVLLGILMATFEKSLSYRVKGFLAGLLAIFIFNAFRIALTVHFFANNQLTASILFHDVLFRLSLVLFLVTYYILWYYYDQPRAFRVPV